MPFILIWWEDAGLPGRSGSSPRQAHDEADPGGSSLNTVSRRLPRPRPDIPRLAEPFEAVNHACRTITARAPNIDFVLTALVERLGLLVEAAFAIFATARCTGWLAHALEQNEAGHLIRPRARYNGPTPEA